MWTSINITFMRQNTKNVLFILNIKREEAGQTEGMN